MNGDIKCGTVGKEALVATSRGMFKRDALDGMDEFGQQLAEDVCRQFCIESERTEGIRHEAHGRQCVGHEAIFVDRCIVLAKQKKLTECQQVNLGGDEVQTSFGRVGSKVGAEVGAVLFHVSARNALIMHPQNLEQACGPPKARVD
nr:hypothetical protein [Nitrobacter sp. Nb-311A]